MINTLKNKVVKEFEQFIRESTEHCDSYLELAFAGLVSFQFYFESCTNEKARIERELGVKLVSPDQQSVECTDLSEKTLYRGIGYDITGVDTKLCGPLCIFFYFRKPDGAMYFAINSGVVNRAINKLHRDSIYIEPRWRNSAGETGEVKLKSVYSANNTKYQSTMLVYPIEAISEEVYTRAKFENWRDDSYAAMSSSTVRDRSEEIADYI